MKKPFKPKPHEVHLARRIREAFPELTPEHFARHETDLYVADEPHLAIGHWLQENLEFPKNVRTFVSQEGSGKFGGKLHFEIPFAAWACVYGEDA